MGTEATQKLIHQMLALTLASSLDVHHQYKLYCTDVAPGPDFSTVAPTPADQWNGLDDATIACQGFVENFMQGLAGDPDCPERKEQQLWVA